MRQYETFEEWAAAQPKPPAPEPPPPEIPIIDPWRRGAEERERARADAIAERKATEQREVREARRHEIQLAKAAANGDIDWTALLNSIADGFGNIAERLMRSRRALTR